MLDLLVDDCGVRKMKKERDKPDRKTLLAIALSFPSLKACE
jgi:hypothetical protein